MTTKKTSANNDNGVCTNNVIIMHRLFDSHTCWYRSCQPLNALLSTQQTHFVICANILVIHKKYNRIFLLFRDLLLDKRQDVNQTILPITI